MRRVDEWGRVFIDPATAFELLYRGHEDLSLVHLSDDAALATYNDTCREYDKVEHCLPGNEPPGLAPDADHARRAENWMIDPAIRDIDVREFCLSLCDTDVEKARVREEMDLYEERGLIPLLQLMIFLVDHFRQNKIVWGIGRGSSVASYVLYLLGVHKINSLAFGLDARDFLK